MSQVPLPTVRPRRYPSDTTDAEWQLVSLYLLAGGRGGCPVLFPCRDIVGTIRYLNDNSCLWHALPADLPPCPTVYHYFRTWIWNGTLARLHNRLREHVCHAHTRHGNPTAAIVSS